MALEENAQLQTFRLPQFHGLAFSKVISTGKISLNDSAAHERQ